MSTNLAVLNGSRRVPKEGDIFVMLPPDGAFLYGRVISTKANPLGVGRGILVYIYRRRSNLKEAIPELRPDELLVPPLITNRLPWTRGYFEHLRADQIRSGDRLPQHSFRDSYGRYVNEFGEPLLRPAQPAGQWGLHSFVTIDEEVSKALGIPLAAG